MDWMVQEQERGITITSAATTCIVERPPHQHHRHARPRRLHRRGRALAARPRRRRRRVRRRRRRRAPDRDRVAPGQQVRRARACASSTRWTASAPTSSRAVELHQGPPRVARRRHPAARSAPRATTRASSTCVKMKALVWDGRGARAPSATSPTSRPTSRTRPRSSAPELHRRRRHRRRRPSSRSSSATRRSPPTTCRRAIRKATHRRRDRARAQRLGLQEQGRAAPARRRRRLPAVARSTSRRPRAWTSRARGARAPGRREGAVRGPGVQDRGRPRRQAHLLPGLLAARSTRATEIYNSTKERKERLGRILRCTPTTARTSTSSMAGDIVAGIGFKNTTHRRHAVRPEPPDRPRALEFPEPVIHVAVEPKTKADQDKMGKALYSLSEEDPTFQVRTDEETGQTVISGMGELHLEVLVDRMLREFSVDATVGKPQVAYRETITKTVEQASSTRHKKQTGGSGQFADVVDRPRAHRPRRRLRVRRQDHRRPHPEGVHPLGRPGHPAGPRPPACSPATPRSTCGPPWSTARTTTSTRRRWRSRSPAPWRSRRRPARPSPSCSSRSWRVEVVTPEDYMGDVIGDLSSRRGRIERHGAAGQQPGDPGPGARCRRCSVTLPTSVRGPRAAPRTPCSSTPTSRCRRRSRKRSSPGSAASSTAATAVNASPLTTEKTEAGREP